MNIRVFMYVMGAISISAVIASVVAGELGNSGSVSGLIAIAALAAGSLASMSYLVVFHSDKPVPPIQVNEEAWSQQDTQRRP